MAVFINTKIVISNPVKYKSWGYYVVVNRKDPTSLIINSVDYNGRSKGIAGYIMRNGYISMSRKHMGNLSELLTKTIRMKIDTTLDLVYGRDRMSMASIVKGNLMTFRKNL